MNQEINFIPLDYDYFDWQGKNYVKILGRDDKGKRVCLIDRFEPYFWAILKEGTSEKSELESGLRCGLDSFDKNYFKSEFNVIKTEKNDYGGIVAYIAFLNNHDRVFWTWVYQYAGGEFTLRGFCEYAALIEQ